jgi:hypothetical protein
MKPDTLTYFAPNQLFFYAGSAKAQVRQGNYLLAT